MVVFENTIFRAITQWAIDYTRLGSDESTTGGSLTINHCVFDEVNDREDQTIIRQQGIKHIAISNTLFMNSSAKWVVRLMGPGQNAQNCNVYLCGKIGAFMGAKAENILEVKPKFQKNSYLAHPKSALLKAATDGQSIGIIVH